MTGCRLHALLLALALLLPVHAVAATAADTEIEYLLEFIASSGCTFVRNGDDHDSMDAADQSARCSNRRYRPPARAEQFIDRLATQSSWSGDPYTVTCEGKTQPSGQWLHRALAQYRQAPVANTP